MLRFRRAPEVTMSTATIHIRINSARIIHVMG
jgi:hypothetical protein